MGSKPVSEVPLAWARILASPLSSQAALMESSLPSAGGCETLWFGEWGLRTRVYWALRTLAIPGLPVRGAPWVRAPQWWGQRGRPG